MFNIEHCNGPINCQWNSPHIMHHLTKQHNSETNFKESQSKSIWLHL